MQDTVKISNFLSKGKLYTTAYCCAATDNCFTVRCRPRFDEDEDILAVLPAIIRTDMALMEMADGDLTSEPRDSDIKALLDFCEKYKGHLFNVSSGVPGFDKLALLQDIDLTEDVYEEEEDEGDEDEDEEEDADATS